MSRIGPDGLGLLTTAEAAAQVGVAEGSIYRWVSLYGLRRVKWEGRSYLVERDVLELDRKLRTSSAKAGGSPRRAARGAS